MSQVKIVIPVGFGYDVEDEFVDEEYVVVVVVVVDVVLMLQLPLLQPELRLAKSRQNREQCKKPLKVLKKRLKIFKYRVRTFHVYLRCYIVDSV